MQYKMNTKWLISLLLSAVMLFSPIAVRAEAVYSAAAGESETEAFYTENTENNASGNEAAENGASGKENAENVISASEAAENEASGNESAGNETSGSESAGSETSGSEAAGSETSGNESAENGTSGNETSGNEAAGNETSENGESSDSTENGESGQDTEAGEIIENPENIDPDAAADPDGEAVPEEGEEGVLLPMITRNDAKLPSGIYTIYTNLSTSKVLEIPGSSQADSTQLDIYEYNDTQAQSFYVKNLGNGLYTIQSCTSGKVLDAAKGKHVNGTVVQQYKSNSGKHQKWYILTSGKSGYYSIASALDKNMVLDIEGGKAANKAKIRLWEYDDKSAQLWQFKMRNPLVELADGAYTISSAKNTSKVLDIKSGSKNNSANVQIYESNGTNAQKFWFEAVGDGYYEITNIGSGRALDVKSGSRKEGTNVQQYTPNRTQAQKWRIFEAANSTYVFYSALGGRVLTVNGSTANSTNVQIGEYTRSDYQRFKLTRTSGSKTAVGGTAPAPTPSLSTGTSVEEAEGLYTIHSLVGGLTMVEVKDGSFDNSANVQIYADNGKNWQKWYLIKKGDWYQIRSAQSGKNLDVKGGSAANSTNVQQYSKNSTDAQLWKFVSTGDKDGSVYIVSKLGKYLDVYGGNPSNNTNVQIYAGNKSKAQKFILAKTTIADGWTTAVDGKEYYYINGRKATGWNKIGSYNFYFDSNGVLLKNTVVDGFTIDSEGRRIGAKISTRPKTLTHKKTILSLLKNAIVPCGRVLYVWAGGHEDSVANGLAAYPDFWDDFYVKHASTDYNRHDYEYAKEAGLDCSGYVAWVVYNTLYSKNGQEWMAYATSEMKNYYLNKGYANPDYITFKAATTSTLPGKVYPGDLCIMAGHVMICLGTCSDGSVVFIHSSPSEGDGGGVQISGTKKPVQVTKDGKTTIEWKSDSQAAALAQKYMSKYFPEWPFGTRSALPAEYMKFAYGRIHWNTDVLTDPEGVIKMSANKVLELLLGPV